MKKRLFYIINLIKQAHQGQSMVEYALIISLVVLVVILSVTNFGEALLDLYTNIKDAILAL